MTLIRSCIKVGRRPIQNHCVSLLIKNVVCFYLECNYRLSICQSNSGEVSTAFQSLWKFAYDSGSSTVQSQVCAIGRQAIPDRELKEMRIC